MELIEPIYAKIVQTLVEGSNTLDIVFDIDSNEMIAWWLIYFDSSWWYTWAMFPIKALGWPSK